MAQDSRTMRWVTPTWVDCTGWWERAFAQGPAPLSGWGGSDVRVPAEMATLLSAVGDAGADETVPIRGVDWRVPHGLSVLRASAWAPLMLSG